MDQGIVKPEHVPLLEKAGVPPEKMEQYILDLNSIINHGFDLYFEELKNKNE
jgi:hypothetical protein